MKMAMPHSLSRRNFLFALVGISLLPWTSRASAAIKLIEPFQFGYVTGASLITGMADSYKLFAESQLFLQDAIKHLSQEKLDFVLFGGDNIEEAGADEANWQLFLDVIQNLSCPWNFVLGETDVSGPIGQDKMRVFGRDWKGKGINTNTTYWSQNPLAGLHLIGLDTSQPDTALGNLSDEQLEWLKSDLEKNKHTFTMVVSHHPLLPPPPYDGGPPWDDYIVPQGPNAREIFGQNPQVSLAVSGHTHVNKIQQEKSVWYVSSASLAVYPCQYKIFRVDNDGVIVETYQISFPALVKKAKEKLYDSELAYMYDRARPQLFLALAEGDKVDENARLRFVTGAAIEPLTAKRKKSAPVNEQAAEPNKSKNIKENPPPTEHKNFLDHFKGRNKHNNSNESTPDQAAKSAKLAKPNENAQMKEKANPQEKAKAEEKPTDATSTPQDNAATPATAPASENQSEPPKHKSFFDHFKGQSQRYKKTNDN